MTFLTHLKDGQQGLGEVVEAAAFLVYVVEVELAAEHLHPEQSEDDDEEEEQEQQRGDGLHGVEQRCHQVTERCPVSAQTQKRKSPEVISCRNIAPSRSCI